MNVIYLDKRYYLHISLVEVGDKDVFPMRVQIALAVSATQPLLDVGCLVWVELGEKK